MPGIEATVALATNTLIPIAVIGVVLTAVSAGLAARHRGFLALAVTGLMVAGGTIYAITQDRDRELDRTTSALEEHYDVTLDDVDDTILREPAVTTATATPADGDTPIPVTLVATGDRIVMFTTTDMREWDTRTNPAGSAERTSR